MQIPTKLKSANGLSIVTTFPETSVFFEPAVSNPYPGLSFRVVPYTLAFSAPRTRILTPMKPRTVNPETETSLTGRPTDLTFWCSATNPSALMSIPAMQMPAWLPSPVKPVQAFSTRVSGGSRVTPLPTRVMPSFWIVTCWLYLPGATTMRLPRGAFLIASEMSCPLATRIVLLRSYLLAAAWTCQFPEFDSFTFVRCDRPSASGRAEAAAVEASSVARRSLSMMDVDCDAKGYQQDG